jgi:tetratricopeptide (TPR) repeat protein
LKQAGKIEEAIAHYEQALRIEPDFAEAHYNLGDALARLGKVPDAIGHFEQALRLKLDYAEAYNSLGNLLATEGRTAEAIEQFQKALAVKPDYAKARYNLADILTAHGRWDEAMEQYQQELKQMPDSTYVHYQLGLLLQGQGKFAPAIAQFQKILELDPGHVPAQNNLAWLLATCPDDSVRNGKKAVELAQQAVQLSGGKSPEILDTLAAAYAEAGRFPEAVETAGRALNLSVAQNKKPLADAIQTQRTLYQAGSPFRDINLMNGLVP